jgi:hypothetical protein
MFVFASVTGVLVASVTSAERVDVVVVAGVVTKAA